ncbi:MAG TPA: post-COAP-1 domain-containing protein [Candidatus Acidoferrales bacterium]|nr:post-COAP-1 domain-containing protein [Candidatus Acidoferrales bacterium]
MKKGQITIAKLASALLAVGFLAAILMSTTTSVSAHIVPSPCDFTTGGGFVLTDQGNHANFGLVGGCKNGAFFGHVNFVDHDPPGTNFFAGLHVSSDTIDAYFEPFAGSNVRDICGTADTNNPSIPTVKFRARTEDNGEPGIGVDMFGLKITATSGPFTGTSAVVVSTRLLAGGNIQLHKPNPSTTGPSTPPDEFNACGSADSGLGS